MKKIFLLCAVLGAGQLYGMADIKHEIIKKAIESSKNIDEAVKAVKVGCTLQGACYNNLKDFTRLMGLLANKFPGEYRNEISKNFNTPVAKEYLDLNGKFINLLNGAYSNAKLLIAKKLLSEGADPNFTWKRDNGALLKNTKFLAENSDEGYQSIVDLLIQYGAKE